MKNTLFILFLLTTFNASAQDSSGIENSKSTSYIGWITKKVNFRVGPSKDYRIIKSLERGNQIFIISDIPENSYYNIIDIESNMEGYVHKAFVEVGDKIEKSKGEMFTSKGTTNKYDTEIEIYNNTNKTLTLKLNKNRFKFSPQEKRTISMKPGDINYVASASNVIPLTGSKSFDEYSSWTWQFYIKPQYDNQINIEKIKVPDFKFEKIKVPNFKVPEIPKSDNKAYLNKTVYTPTTNAFDNFKSKYLNDNDESNSKQFYNDEGIKKYKNGDYNGAILNYNKSIELDPNYSIAIYNRGLSKYELEDYLEAIKDFDKAIELGYKNPNLHSTRGLSNYKIKDYYEFLWDYDKAIELDPNVAFYYVNRGVAKEMTFNPYGAITDYSEAISINPDYALAYFKRGKVKEKTANFEGACVDFKRAAYLGHKDAKIWVEKQCK
jgi:tetratricopeptide (TPR) repeat protein